VQEQVASSHISHIVVKVDNWHYTFTNVISGPSVGGEESLIFYGSEGVLGSRMIMAIDEDEDSGEQIIGLDLSELFSSLYV
jgi:hypothetical protein